MESLAKTHGENMDTTPKIQINLHNCHFNHSSLPDATLLVCLSHQSA